MGSIANSSAVLFSVGDYTISGTQALTTIPGVAATGNLTFKSIDSYSGTVDVACDVSALVGAHCVLSPAYPILIGNGASVALAATVNVPTSAVAGTYNIKLNTQDATGEPVHVWTLPVTVQDFAVGAITPPSQTVGGGQSATYNLSVVPAGTAFTDAVTLSCSGQPANSVCTFTPNPVTPGSGAASVVLTISTSSTATPGNNSVVVTGISGSLSHSATLSLTIGSSFQLALTQPFPSGADPGSQPTAKISLSPNYSGKVNASCDATALAATQCTVTPASPIAINDAPITVTALLNIPTSAAVGTYNARINIQDAGASGTPSASITIPFTVIQDFTLGSLTPTTQSITPGESASYNFSVLPVGTAFTNAVSLSCSGGPALSLCSFTPNPITPGNSSAAVVMSLTTTANSSNSYRAPIVFALWLALPALALLRKKKRLRVPSALFGLVFIAVLLTSCGGGGSNGGSSPGGSQQGTQSGTYTIIVTGAFGSLSHSAPGVTLIVN